MLRPAPGGRRRSFHCKENKGKGKRPDCEGGSLLQLPDPAFPVFRLDGAPRLVHEACQAAAAAHPGIVRNVRLRHGARLAVERQVKAGRPAPDELALGGVEVVPQEVEPGGLGAEQLDGEVHRDGPVTPDEPSHNRVPVEAAEEMIPDPRERKMRLPHIEGHGLIAE